MSNNYYKCLVGIFVGFIGIFFAINLFSADVKFSEMENRILEQKPKFTFAKLFSGEFTKDYEEYVTDQFFMRDAWVGLKYVAERSMLKTENNGIYFADDHYLMTKFKIPEQRRLMLNFESVGKLIDSLAIPVHFSLVPTSAYVHSDKLPLFATPYDQQLILDEAAKRYPDNYIDMAQKLVDNKNGYIYYRTDHHWTSDGAYIGYRALCEVMELEPFVRGEKFGTYRDFYGTLYSNAGARFIPADTIEAYEIPHLTLTDPEGKELAFYDESYGDKKDKYAVFLGGNHPLVTVKNQDNLNGKKLLLIKDSYSNALLPYLSNNYEEIHVLDLRYNKASIVDYVEENGLTEALVLYSTDNFATDANMFIMGK